MSDHEAKNNASKTGATNGSWSQVLTYLDEFFKPFDITTLLYPIRCKFPIYPVGY